MRARIGLGFVICAFGLLSSAGAQDPNYVMTLESGAAGQCDVAGAPAEGNRFFVVGGALLSRVDVEAGREAAVS